MIRRMGTRCLVAATVALLVSACGREDRLNNGYDRNDTWRDRRDGNGGSGVQELRTVDMTADGQFKPREITIDVGETVSWKNLSSEMHTVSSETGLPPGAQAFDSGDVTPGVSWSHTFTVAGTYPYFCRHHKDQGMTGTVIVRPPVK